MSATPEKWCEHCGSTIVGAHMAGCGEAPVDIKPRLEVAPEPEKKITRKRASCTLRFDDGDADIDTMKALVHIMDYQIKRAGLTQRQIDRIGNWFIDKYIDEIKWP